MIRSVRILVSAFIIVLLASMALPAAMPLPEGSAFIGIVSKIILDVSRKEAGKSWEKAARGQVLATGDMIRTGKKSLAIIKLKDNSLVRVREESELTITGGAKGGAFSKSVDVQTGVVGFNVQKQKPGEEFRFTSPTSVASIRGTTGAYVSSDTASFLPLLDGLAQLRSTISNRTVDVQGGYIGFCRRDGSIGVRPLTPADRRLVTNALQDDVRMRLEIDLQNPQGKSNRLRIEIKE
jgi:hypothetical protein